MPECTLRILHVEDNPSDARLVRHELERAGFSVAVTRVETEADYLAGLDARPHVILCDYNLPAFDAPRALELSRQRSLDIPFLIITGAIGEETAVRAIKLGANDYLLKDRLGRLGVAVRQALEQQSLREAKRLSRKRHARDAMMLASVRDSIIVTDGDGIVTYWNEGSARLWGWTAGEVLGKPAAGWLGAGGTPAPAGGGTAHDADTAWSPECSSSHKDGSLVWTRCRVTRIHAETGETVGHLALSYDITDARAAEAERVAAQLQKEEALREREAILLENARLLRAATESAEQQRTFLKDVLFSVTEGRLSLCDDWNELPDPPGTHTSSKRLGMNGAFPDAVSSLSFPDIVLAPESLSALRRQVTEAATACGLDPERQYDLVCATGEAAMNAVVHATGGTARVFGDPSSGSVQVWIVDRGKGIDLSRLPRATLERGYSTAGSLGHGFWMILRTCDRVYLLTGALGTTVVLEQERVAAGVAWIAGTERSGC